MPDDGSTEQRLKQLESRCGDLEAALATIVDAIAGQVDIQAETARTMEALMQEVMRLRDARSRPATPLSSPKPDLQSIPGGKSGKAGPNDPTRS